jgi:NitT/TauT family transport system substrate-binding protein
MRPASRWIGALAALLSLAVSAPATAEDTLKLAIGQRGNWEQSAPEIGSRAGIFKKYDLNIERTYTAGAGETLQAVISGAVDIGTGVGTAGALSAFTKGAPGAASAIRPSARTTLLVREGGFADPSLKDANDTTTIAYSTSGSTNMLVLGFIKTYNLKAQPAKIGNPPTTLTAVMSGQVDIGGPRRRSASRRSTKAKSE